ncbi:hypothetical protein KAI19_02845 [bacterium]|nr:hypothetical protein [bacterium]
MNIKKGFLRLTIVFSIIVYAIAFVFSFMHFDNCRSSYLQYKMTKIEQSLSNLIKNSFDDYRLFLEKFRNKYPEYDDLSDGVLLKILAEKYPICNDMLLRFLQQKKVQTNEIVTFIPLSLMNSDIVVSSVGSYKRIQGKYNDAKLSLLLIPLAFFAGVWSLWIIYFIIRALSVWVIRGFKN